MNTEMKTNENIDMLWRGTLAIAAVAAFTMLPLEAIANPITAGTGKNTGLDNLFCNILSAITGPIGAGIATIAIVVIGVGALMGKVSWGMAIIVALGIALIFGASSIVDAIAGQGAATGTSQCTVKQINTTYQ